MSTPLSDVPVPKLPASVRGRLGAEVSSSLEDYVNEMADSRVERALQQVRGEMAALRQDMAVIKQDIAVFRQDMAVFKMEMQRDLANQRAELLKWMFTFWVGQAAVTVGLILAIK